MRHSRRPRLTTQLAGGGRLITASWLEQKVNLRPPARPPRPPWKISRAPRLSEPRARPARCSIHGCKLRALEIEHPPNIDDRRKRRAGRSVERRIDHAEDAPDLQPKRVSLTRIILQGSTYTLASWTVTIATGTAGSCRKPWLSRFNSRISALCQRAKRNLESGPQGELLAAHAPQPMTELQYACLRPRAPIAAAHSHGLPRYSCAADEIQFITFQVTCGRGSACRRRQKIRISSMRYAKKTTYGRSGYG